MSENIAESAERDEGGQAFPSSPPLPFDDGLRHGQSGMTLRDWFAGQALAGIAASITDLASRETEQPGKRLLEAIEGGANLAYALADAALAARK